MRFAWTDILSTTAGFDISEPPPGDTPLLSFTEELVALKAVKVFRFRFPSIQASLLTIELSEKCPFTGDRSTRREW